MLAHFLPYPLTLSCNLWRQATNWNATLPRVICGVWTWLGTTKYTTRQRSGWLQTLSGRDVTYYVFNAQVSVHGIGWYTSSSIRVGTRKEIIEFKHVKLKLMEQNLSANITLKYGYQTVRADELLTWATCHSLFMDVCITCNIRDGRKPVKSSR